MTFAAAYAKERELAAFDKSTAGATCTFKTISQLFPLEDTATPIIYEAMISPAESTNGVNYYGGFATYIDIPEANTGYYYFVTHDNRGTESDSFASVAGNMDAALYVHVCDIPDGTGGCEQGYQDYLDSTLNSGEVWREEKDLVTNEQSIRTLGSSDSINLIKHEPSMQSLSTSVGSNNLNGAISCTDSTLYPGEDGGGYSNTAGSTATGPTCTLSGFEKTWYFGVQSKCQDSASLMASAAKIFAWYKYPEKARQITVQTRDTGGVTGVQVTVSNHAHTENQGDSTTPHQILFAEPVITKSTTNTLSHQTAFEEFSSVRSISSEVRFHYVGSSGGGAAGTNTVTAPDRCSLGYTSDTDASGNALEDGFSTACEASATAQMVIDFRDAPSTEQCASAGGMRSAQIEFSLVQFVRIHTTLNTPDIYNNTAQQFFRSADNGGEWSCLDVDQCVVGDPYKVLAHRIVGGNALTGNGTHPCVSTHVGGQNDDPAIAPTSNDACELTLNLVIENTLLRDPSSLPDSSGITSTPWSYVMGIADFAISDCGTSNFIDHVNRGEYATPTRRLGASVSKPGARHTQLHYGSYKGY